MFHRLFLIYSLFIYSQLIISCKTASKESQSSEIKDNSSKQLVSPSAKEQNVDLAVDVVIKAMRDIQSTFYKNSSVYSVALKDSHGSPIPPPGDEPRDCQLACPKDRWSDIVCHYYCQFPSYSLVSPNIRSCFSSVVKTCAMADGSPDRPLTYQEAYDYCVYQDMDILRRKTPPFDPAIIAKNKASGTKPGPLKWVDDNQREVFQYLMFTSGNLFAFKLVDRKKALDAFYGSTSWQGATPGPPILVPPPPGISGSCDGAKISDYCWYRTNSKSNSNVGDCDVVCSKRGGVHEATIYNFNKGNDGKSCNEVVSEVTGEVYAFGGLVNCGDGSCGCVFFEPSKKSYLCTNITKSVCTPNSTQYPRVCACSQ